jgi:small nuclear ribonucleoprotein (snRNP)-like protein
VGPDFKRYMDKRLAIKLNGNRHITGNTVLAPALWSVRAAACLYLSPPSACIRSPPLRVFILLPLHPAGTLRGFDQFMNLVLDETEELVRSSAGALPYTMPPREPSHIVLHHRSAPNVVCCPTFRCPPMKQTQSGWWLSEATR